MEKYKNYSNSQRYQVSAKVLQASIVRDLITANRGCGIIKFVYFFKIIQYSLLIDLSILKLHIVLFQVYISRDIKVQVSVTSRSLY